MTERAIRAQTVGSASEAESEPVAPESVLAFGMRPVEHFQRVVTEHAARAPVDGRRLLVLTHRGPDPDAIGACEGVRHLCQNHFGVDASVATVGRIHRAENLALVRGLGLDFRTYDDLSPDEFFGAALVDTQPAFGHTVLPKDIPVLAVFDHHVPPGQGQDDAALEVAHRDVRLATGATSSMIYEYLRDGKVDIPELIATALFCGVRYDTADLSRNASPLDEEAFAETFRLADRELITRIHHPPLPRVYYRELKAALDEARQHGPLVIALLGKMSHPEFAAEMADFFLRMKGVSWVVVGGAVQDEQEYVLSLRTDYAFGNAYPLMQRVLNGVGSFGGHGHIAGARISMDSFGKSAISAIERKLRSNALAVLGSSDDGELPPEGDPLG